MEYSIGEDYPYLSVPKSKSSFLFVCYLLILFIYLPYLLILSIYLPIFIYLSLLFSL